MRWLPAATLALLLLESSAEAQTASGPARPATAAEAEIAAQASLQTSYLLTLYMMQLAAAGAPPSQTDIDEASRQYLTNGAAVMGVPTSGPAAAYFTHGAEVMAYGGGAPVTATTAAAPAVRAAGSGDAGAQLDASSPAVTVAAGAAATTTTPEIQPAARGELGPACATFDDLKAVMATIPGPARAASPSTAAVVATPCATPGETVPAPACAACAPSSMAGAAPACPSPTTRSSWVAPALGGALLGGLAVALWAGPRPRPLRVARRPS